MFFVCTDPVYRQTRRIKIKKQVAKIPERVYIKKDSFISVYFFDSAI